jgi:fructokinase
MGAIYGAIEAGGTKFVLACGRGPGELMEERTLPTTTPEETLGTSVAWFREVQGRHGELAGIGVGTFGPAGVHEDAADWGWITTTPKPVEPMGSCPPSHGWCTRRPETRYSDSPFV